MTQGKVSSLKEGKTIKEYLFQIMVSIWVFKHLRRGSWRGLSQAGCVASDMRLDLDRPEGFLFCFVKILLILYM